jgi:hypothetical protein
MVVGGVTHGVIAVSSKAYIFDNEYSSILRLVYKIKPIALSTVSLISRSFGCYPSLNKIVSINK